MQRARTDVGRRLDELHAGVERAEGVEGGAARGRLRRGEAGRVAVGEDVCERGVRVGDGERARVEARDEEADAGDGDDLREGGRAVEAAGLVGDATAPARLARVVGNRRLPQADLIRVGEELQRLSALAVLVGRARQRLDERADV